MITIYTASLHSIEVTKYNTYYGECMQTPSTEHQHDSHRLSIDNNTASPGDAPRCNNTPHRIDNNRVNTGNNTQNNSLSQQRCNHINNLTQTDGDHPKRQQNHCRQTRLQIANKTHNKENAAKQQITDH
jgi:hypothetical protein